MADQNDTLSMPPGFQPLPVPTLHLQFQPVGPGMYQMQALGEGMETISTTTVIACVSAFLAQLSASLDQQVREQTMAAGPRILRPV